MNKKKNTRRIIKLICLLLVVAFLAAMPLMAKQEEQTDGPEASILSGSVSAGSIHTELIGGGTLAEEDAVTIEIPTAVKLTEYLVSNGETVTEGTAIATVDRVSVMTAIQQVQETLEYLSEEIADADDYSSSKKVTALAGGTVKVIYAEEGETVQKVILDHGALAVLSLDGLMAVDLETESTLPTGTAVTVTLSDGAEASGKIVKNLAGEMTVTVEDDDYALNDIVQVTAEDGTAIGSGQLYIYSPWNATAYAGTVDSIKVSVGDELSAGKTIMVLSDVGYSAAYRQLISQRQEYENLMLELFQMYRTETITAPCDGVVSGVDKDSAYLLSDSSDSKVMELLASYGIRQDNGYVVNTVQAIKNPEKGSVILTLSAGSASEPNPAPEPEPTDPQPIDPTPTEPTPSEPTPIEPPVETVVYYGYVAQVMELADGKLKVKQTPYSYTITDLNQLPVVTVDVNALTQEAIYDISRITLPDPAVNDYLLLIVTADGTLTHFVQQQPPTSGGQPGAPSGPGVGGGGGFPSGGGYPSGGMSGGYPSGSMTEQESAYELYGLDMVQIVAVTPQDTMTLDITIDELDIKALQVGMTAQVKINALGGEKYTAAITEIGNTGVSDGGNSKYTVELTMDRAENMLSGMNATATIVLSTAMDILTIPADALVEQGNQTVVYTGYDEENEVLLNPVTVKVGCSDGETVEILEGLANGQTYYYAYYDTLEISFTPDFGADGFMFG